MYLHFAVSSSRDPVDVGGTFENTIPEFALGSGGGI